MPRKSNLKIAKKILETVREAGKPLSITQIAERTGLHFDTVKRWMEIFEVTGTNYFTVERCRKGILAVPLASWRGEKMLSRGLPLDVKVHYLFEEHGKEWREIGDLRILMEKIKEAIPKYYTGDPEQLRKAFWYSLMLLAANEPRQMATILTAFLEEERPIFS
ncbi:MAG: hypothetical protein ACTSU5_06280 [Promethearchaeota archaeon]